MAWTSPLTAALNGTLTAAQFNSSVRDNLLETEVAKSNRDSGYFVATGANAIAERTVGIHTVESPQTTTSTSYTNLKTSGPSVSITTGTQALVFYGANMANSGGNAYAAASVEVSGASTVAASDDWQISIDGLTAADACRRSSAHLFTGLTAGTNRFRMKYKVSSGTGTFNRRHMMVMPL